MKSLVKNIEIYPTLKELLASQTKLSSTNVPRLTGHCELAMSKNGNSFTKLPSHSAMEDPVDADAFTISVAQFHHGASYKELLLDLLRRDKEVTKVLFRECMIRICYVGGDFDFIPDLYVETIDQSVTLIDLVSSKQRDSASFLTHQVLIQRYCESRNIRYLCLVNHYSRQQSVHVEL
jgi:hypothetical protein